MDFYFICFISLACACFCIWIFNRVIALEYFLSVALSVVISSTLFFVLCSLSIEDPQELKSYPNGSYIQVEGNELSVKVIEGNHAMTQTFSITELEVLESRSDSSASILPRNSSEIKHGKKPYAIYLPVKDYETVQSLIY